MMQEIRSTVGGRIKAFRKGLGITQREMQGELHTGTDFVGRLERGDMLPNPSFLIRLRMTYGADLNSILCGPCKKG
jgi:transcriptional regulator with XRE-family HTH domain